MKSTLGLMVHFVTDGKAHFMVSLVMDLYWLGRRGEESPKPLRTGSSAEYYMDIPTGSLKPPSGASLREAGICHWGNGGFAEPTRVEHGS